MIKVMLSKLFCKHKNSEIFIDKYKDKEWSNSRKPVLNQKGIYYERSKKNLQFL